MDKDLHSATTCHSCNAQRLVDRCYDPFLDKRRTIRILPCTVGSNLDFHCMRTSITCLTVSRVMADNAADVCVLCGVHAVTLRQISQAQRTALRKIGGKTLAVLDNENEKALRKLRALDESTAANALEKLKRRRVEETFCTNSCTLCEEVTNCLGIAPRRMGAGGDVSQTPASSLTKRPQTAKEKTRAVVQQYLTRQCPADSGAITAQSSRRSFFINVRIWGRPFQPQ
eukprot:IDg22435t1